jgi:hypothetical protein
VLALTGHWGLETDRHVFSWLLPVFLPMASFYVGLGLALAGLKSIRGWKVAAALLLTWLASGFFFGMVKPPGSYGLHPTIAIWRDPTDHHLHLNIGYVSN